MPSDDRGSTLTQALGALSAPREAFDSALALTAEEVRGFLDTHRTPEENAPQRVAAELGHFALSHIDADRFANLVDRQRPVDVEALHDAEKGWSGLLALRERGEDLHVVRVPSGGDLVSAAKGALAEAGRAFGLARSVRFVRNGESDRGVAVGDPFPSRLWSEAERALAPPLVIEVDGSDLRVSGLDDLLEGSQKLILVVRGPSPPAPLARLIRPGLLVVQTTVPDGLHMLSRESGAAIAAVLPEGSAVFTHDPRGGPAYAVRLVVEHVPENTQVTAIGGLSARHALDDLEHLRALTHSAPAATTVHAGDSGIVKSAPADATPAAASESPGALAVAISDETTTAPNPGATSAAVTEPADRLAGWLLEQAGF